MQALSQLSYTPKTLQSLLYSYKVTVRQRKTPLGALCILAEWTGLEPATPGVTGRYSNQLNYHSMIPALQPRP